MHLFPPDQLRLAISGPRVRPPRGEHRRNRGAVATWRHRRCSQTSGPHEKPAIFRVGHAGQESGRARAIAATSAGFRPVGSKWNPDANSVRLPALSRTQWVNESRSPPESAEHGPVDRNWARRVWSTSWERFWRVKTLPRVARSRFFMSSRRTPNPRPAIQAMNSNLGSASARPCVLSVSRCWTRVTLSRAVPSSSVSFASMTTWGLNSFGTTKSGVWSNPGRLSARFVLR